MAILIDITEISALMDGSGNQWERLVSLTDINDRGDIVGMGIINGKLHGFLLLRL